MRLALSPSDSGFTPETLRFGAAGSADEEDHVPICVGVSGLNDRVRFMRPRGTGFFLSSEVANRERELRHAEATSKRSDVP